MVYGMKAPSKWFSMELYFLNVSIAFLFLRRLASLCRVMYLCFQNDKRMIIIPDVHGRSFWRNAIEEPIFFLGDYLDSDDNKLIKI